MEFSSDTITSVLTSKIIHTEIRYKALEELLIEKETISEQAIEERCELVMARDGKKLYDETVKQFANIEEKANK